GRNDFQRGQCYRVVVETARDGNCPVALLRQDQYRAVFTTRCGCGRPACHLRPAGGRCSNARPQSAQHGSSMLANGKSQVQWLSGDSVIRKVMKSDDGPPTCDQSGRERKQGQQQEQELDSI